MYDLFVVFLLHMVYLWRRILVILHYQVLRVNSSYEWVIFDQVEKYEDESFEVAEECTEGTVAECINTGMVSGDLDLAGIAGTMGIEYDFDLPLEANSAP